jgi:molybdopterin converting factor small subunit
VKIPVLLFASYAEAFGAATIEMTLDPGATVTDLLDRVKAMGAGRALPPAPLVAVNRCFASPGQRIEAGDEVALIPPVAGG